MKKLYISGSAMTLGIESDTKVVVTFKKENPSEIAGAGVFVTEDESIQKGIEATPLFKSGVIKLAPTPEEVAEAARLAELEAHIATLKDAIDVESLEAYKRENLVALAEKLDVKTNNKKKEDIIKSIKEVLA